MTTSVELILDNNIYFIDIRHIVDKDGNLSYICELYGITISTFPYREKFDGRTQDEALGKIAKALRIAINKLLEY